MLVVLQFFAMLRCHMSFIPLQYVKSPLLSSLFYDMMIILCLCLLFTAMAPRQLPLALAVATLCKAKSRSKKEVNKPLLIKKSIVLNHDVCVCMCVMCSVLSILCYIMLSMWCDKCFLASLAPCTPQGFRTTRRLGACSKSYPSSKSLKWYVSSFSVPSSLPPM